MKKINLIFIFVMVFSGLASARGLYPISMADLIYPTCNNNGRCDYFESSQNCPNECPVVQDTGQDTGTITSDETTTTTVSMVATTTTLSIATTVPPFNVDQDNTQDALGIRSQIITKEPIQIPWKLVLSFIFSIIVVVFIIVLFLWYKKKPKRNRKSKGKKETTDEDEFGLPSRPKRKFGV